MIDKSEVVQLVEERIEELNSNLFWVSVDIGTGNTIKVVLDGDKGVSILAVPRIWSSRQRVHFRF